MAGTHFVVGHSSLITLITSTDLVFTFPQWVHESQDFDENSEHCGRQYSVVLHP
jgi:hypothetical protein